MALRFSKEEITLHYKDDKPTAYKLQLVREQVVKYKQLCRNISANTGIRKGEVEDVLDALAQQMLQMMEMGHAVQLGVLGTFKPSAITKCSKSKDELSADNIVRFKINFYPGEVFKEMLADMEIETEADDDDDESTRTEGGEDNNAPEGGGGTTPDEGGDDGEGPSFD